MLEANSRPWDTPVNHLKNPEQDPKARESACFVTGEAESNLRKAFEEAGVGSGFEWSFKVPSCKKGFRISFGLRVVYG